MGAYLGAPYTAGWEVAADSRGFQEATDLGIDAGCNVKTLGDELGVDIVVGKESSEAAVGRQGITVLVDLRDYKWRFQVAAG